MGFLLARNLQGEYRFIDPRLAVSHVRPHSADFDLVRQPLTSDPVKQSGAVDHGKQVLGRRWLW